MAHKHIHNMVSPFQSFVFDVCGNGEENFFLYTAFRCNVTLPFTRVLSLSILIIVYDLYGDDTI